MKAIFFHHPSTRFTCSGQAEFAEFTLRQAQGGLRKAKAGNNSSSFRAEPANKPRSLLFPSLLARRSFMRRRLRGGDRGEGEITAMTRNPVVLVIASRHLCEAIPVQIKKAKALTQRAAVKTWNLWKARFILKQ